MLKYCAWCGKYQGATTGKGHQIRKNLCEIDTSTICPRCLSQVFGLKPDALVLRR